MSPSSAVHGGQHDTKYVTFELLLRAAFVADEIWGFMREPARIQKKNRKNIFCRTARISCFKLATTVIGNRYRICPALPSPEGDPLKF